MFPFSGNSPAMMTLYVLGFFVGSTSIVPDSTSLPSILVSNLSPLKVRIVPLTSCFSPLRSMDISIQEPWTSSKQDFRTTGLSLHVTRNRPQIKVTSNTFFVKHLLLNIRKTFKSSSLQISLFLRKSITWKKFKLTRSVFWSSYLLILVSTIIPWFCQNTPNLCRWESLKVQSHVPQKTEVIG